jgi:hypothetical protein
LIALVCSPAPAGHVSWTICLLTDKMVELRYVERVGRETVGPVLKKTNSSRGKMSSIAFLLKRMLRLSARWKKAWTSTRARMILYTRKYAWMRTSKQLVSKTRVPITAEPGQVERYDYEYERQGS